MKRYLIVYEVEGGGEMEIEIKVAEHDNAVRDAKRLAQALECSVHLKQLGVIDDWIIDPVRSAF